MAAKKSILILNKPNLN